MYLIYCTLIAYLKSTFLLKQTLACYKKKHMDKTARRYTRCDDTKSDEFRYFQSQPVHERFDAVEKMLQAAYAIKGWKLDPDVPRLQRPFIRIQCPWR